MLASIAGAHFWLYRVHGLSKSLDATLSTPSGLPLPLTVGTLSYWLAEAGVSRTTIFSKSSSEASRPWARTV